MRLWVMLSVRKTVMGGSKRKALIDIQNFDSIHSTTPSREQASRTHVYLTKITDLAWSDFGVVSRLWVLCCRMQVTHISILDWTSANKTLSTASKLPIAHQ